MAVKTGHFLADTIVIADESDLGQHFNVEREGWTYPAGGLLASVATSGSKADTQPITEPTRAFAGGVVEAFVADYYYRFHFSALSYNVGNIIGTIERTLTMWNSFFNRKTVEVISSSGTAGVDITGVGASGLDVVRPLQQVETLFTIGIDGDPLLRARYTFRIDDPEE